MKFLFLRLLLSLLLVLGFGNLANADSDDVEWSGYSLYVDYDSGDEELTLDFVTYSDGNPGEDFVLEMEVGDEDCEMDLEYASFQLKGECILDIDEEDVQGLYDTSLTVYDEDDDSVYTDSGVEFVIEGYEEDFEWDKLIVDASYEEENEKIELRVYLANVSSEPDYDYEVEFEIDEKTFSEDFKWDEDEEEYYIELKTSIDENDIEDEYEIDFKIFNTDLDDEKVGDEEIEFRVDILSKEDDYDWDDIEYTAVYDEDRERLNLHFFLENIKIEPQGRYESFIEFEDEDYDEKFNYDEDSQQLIAEYSIKIDEDDLGSYYFIDLIVENEEEDEVFDDEVDVDIEYLSEADDYDWNNLVVSASYDDNGERVYIDLVLENIKSTPVFTYSTDIEFADEEEFAVFSYDSDKDELRASINVRIDEDDLEDKYEFEVRVNNIDQDDEVFDKDIDLELEEYQINLDESDSSYKWSELSVSLMYDADERYLNVNVVLPNVDDYPELDYFAELNIGNFGKLSSKLRYNSAEDTLYGNYELYVRESDITDEYKVTIFVNDENKKLLSSYVQTLGVNFEGDDSISPAVKTAVSAFIDRSYKKYNNQDDTLEYFGLVIEALNDYAIKKPQNKTVVDDINYLLEMEIESRQ